MSARLDQYATSAPPQSNSGSESTPRVYEGERRRGKETPPTLPAEYRWASETASHGMATPDELSYLGFDYCRRDGEIVRDPRYPASILMWRRA